MDNRRELTMDYTWAERASCKDMDPALFFPQKPVDVEIWKICKECPVRIECLTFAIENKIDHGVWGGFGERARRRIKRRSRENATR
jgi:WhiB family redox-sensing transcriptional regulator